MARIECTQEERVVAAVLSGAWLAHCDEDLKAHAAQCEICSEVVAVASLLRQDHEHARREVQVPAAGQVWWRAAVRARLEAAQSAGRPVTWMHGITAACTIGLFAAVISIAWPSIVSLAAQGKALIVGLAPAADVASVMTGPLRQSLPMVLVGVACLIAAPIALYFALADNDRKRRSSR